MALDEKILVVELKDGNTKACEKLFFHYHKKLYNFCFKITGNTQESEDLVQDIFISVWNNKEKLDESRSFGNFVFKIARNKALNVIKHNINRQIYIQYANKDDLNHLDTEIETQELLGLINRSISSLPPQTQKIFSLSRNDGLTYKEIAQKLDITENVVDHDIRKALKCIKESLSGWKNI